MEKVFFTDNLTYNNILYIGDNAMDCLKIIEKFTGSLLKIEKHFTSLFNNPRENHIAGSWLQHHIQYHFEGGVAIFKFRNEDELPPIVRNECIVACRDLAFEQLVYAPRILSP